MFRSLIRLGFFALLWVSTCEEARAQFAESRYSVNLAAQINFQHNLRRNYFRNSFPGVKLSVGINSYHRLSKTNKNDFYPFLTLGSSLAIYNKALGNSLNVNYQDNQFDWTSNVNLGAAYKESPFYKNIHSIHNTPFYSISHKADYALFIGTNFIMNSSKRNQTVGQVGMTVKNVSMNYYNDGGPGIKQLGLGDGFDRYWTGGIMLYLHYELIYKNDSIPFNRIEVSFDQFTGYRPQLFQLQSIIGLDIQDYDIYDLGRDSTNYVFNQKPSKNKGFSFNASQYQVRYFFGPNYAMNLGIYGALRGFDKEMYWALQDIIHVKRSEPVHPNYETNRLQLGINYYNQFWCHGKR